jgi:hypothetical protein
VRVEGGMRVNTPGLERGEIVPDESLAQCSRTQGYAPCQVH